MLKEDKNWNLAGNVIEMADASNRPYQVQTDQGVYWRNRKDIHALPEKRKEITLHPPVLKPVPQPNQSQHSPKAATPTQIRSSARIRRPPFKLKDYVSK